MKQMRRHALSGFMAGLLNGFLGAGGGMIIVPMLEKNGLKPPAAHATSIAVIVPLCMLSAVLYMFSKSLSFTDALPYLPAWLVGSFVGAKTLPRIPDGLLRRIFGAFMLYAALRLLWR